MAKPKDTRLLTMAEWAAEGKIHRPAELSAYLPGEIRCIGHALEVGRRYWQGHPTTVPDGR